MIYLWPKGGSMIGMHDGFGVMASPAMMGVPLGIKQGRWWGCDNGAFTKAFDAPRFLEYLEMLKPYAHRCMFVVVPDVWGDAGATMDLFDMWAGPLAADWPIAFAAQPGLESIDHWPIGFDWLFVGGTDEWRSGPGVKTCIARAKAQGALVHIGRVNSIKRFQYFQRLGADSADGTKPVFAASDAERLLTRAVAQPDFLRRIK